MQENKNPENLNEFDVPTPERKNEDITTNDTGKTNNSDRVNDKGSNTGNNDKNKTEQDKRLDNDKEREERVNPDNRKFQDAGWHQDKMNEANNQPGVNVDSKGEANQNAISVDKEASVSDVNKKRGELGDTREDSILNRPRNETYEKEEGENIGKTIRKENYTHVPEERKRDDQNRKNRERIEEPDAEKRKREKKETHYT
jgi:hypothetical protein